LRIGIIGCGVAGQASAIALARAGHDVSVFERFETARPLGAGLLLQPSGLSALARLGLREQAESWGARVSELDGRIASGKRVLDLAYGEGE
jgi:2-polyprenyl-6-methoxyphenol hydroxylase-like FAD-dependent oxidoreductase